MLLFQLHFPTNFPKSPYYGVNIHTDAQGEFGTILNSNDIFPDLPLINAATVIDQSDDHEVIIIDAAAERMLPDELIAG